MGLHLDIYGASAFQITLYYVFVMLSFAYMLHKYRDSQFSIYIILFFYTGLISALGKGVFDAFKIVLLMLSLHWVYKSKSFMVSKTVQVAFICFMLFSFSFLYTSIINGDYIILILSQYSRYFIVIILLFLFSTFRLDTAFRSNCDKIVYDVLIVQVGLSIAKFLIMGPRESLVGSITSQGGAAATILPIFGFIFLWIRNKGTLLKKDWLLTAGLLFVGFVGAKRAIWFVFPMIVSVFMFYVPKRRISVKYLTASVLAGAIIFYLGLRISPSLNPEQKIWGSFDVAYAFDFANKYAYGDPSRSDQLQGRNSTTNFIIEKFLLGSISNKDWFGYGLRFMYTTNYEEFAKLGFYTSHKGSATGIFQTLISNGLVGIFANLIFAFSLISIVRDVRFKLVLIGIYLWEYLYYTGSILREHSLAFLFIYIIVFADFFVVKEVENK